MRKLFYVVAPLLFNLALAWLLLGCGTVTPIPDPEPAPVDYAAVCQHLADIGCSEGRAPSCARVFAQAQDDRLTDLKPACLLTAVDPPTARACGTVACQ
jgi:hypothetical protein